MEVVEMPYSYLEWCNSAPLGACFRTKPITLKELALLNLEITEAIQTVENEDYYDQWKAFPRDAAGRITGDCDDDVATKRQALMLLGIPPTDMWFETGMVTEPDGRKLRHIVLNVRVGDKVYVMDRKTPNMLYTPDKRPYTWEPIAREDRSQVTWTATS